MQKDGIFHSNTVTFNSWELAVLVLVSELLAIAIAVWNVIAWVLLTGPVSYCLCCVMRERETVQGSAAAALSEQTFMHPHPTQAGK